MKILIVSFFVEGTYLKPITTAFALGAFFHLILDSLINKGMTFKGYSILYRIKNDFSAEKIVTIEQYKKDFIRKNEKK